MRKEAKIAALASSKVAGKQQRNAMLKHLSKMASDLEINSHEDPVMRRHSKRLSRLYEEIASYDWTTIEAAEEKQRLYECNPELLEALNKAD